MATSLRAEVAGLNDQQFAMMLDQVKDPFVDGIPKPVEPIKPVLVAVSPEPPMPVQQNRQPIVVPVVLPALKLQGVLVGDGMNEAIINDRAVPLNYAIDEARVVSVSQQGVGLVYKGKKFFLKIE